MRRERIDLRVTPAEKEKWAEFGKARGLGLSELIRRAVNNLIKLSEQQAQK